MTLLARFRVWRLKWKLYGRAMTLAGDWCIGVEVDYSYGCGPCPGVEFACSNPACYAGPGEIACAVDARIDVIYQQLLADHGLA